jgi:hypothetical protein
LCFIFLDANHIGRVVFKPVKKSFLHRSADPVDIVTDNFHEPNLTKAPIEVFRKGAMPF